MDVNSNSADIVNNEQEVKQNSNDSVGSNESTQQTIDNNLVQTILKEINNAQATAPEETSGSPYIPNHQPQQTNLSPEIYKQYGVPYQGGLHPGMVHQMRPEQLQQMQNPNMQDQHMYNSQIMDIINEDTLYNRLTKHIKETIIIMCLFVLLSCESVRSACATNIPKLGTEDNSLNMFGTVLLSVFFGLTYIIIKQFM